MRSVSLTALFIVTLWSMSTLGRTVRPEDQPINLNDYNIVSPFFTCGPGDPCIELPEIPPVWRFIPELFGWRKFTPVGATFYDWTNFMLSRNQVWWDSSLELGDNFNFRNYNSRMLFRDFAGL